MMRPFDDSVIVAERTEAELLEASLERVWYDHDDTQRLVAIGELSHPDARLYELKRPMTRHQAISDVVAGILAGMPVGFGVRVKGRPSAITAWMSPNETVGRQ